MNHEQLTESLAVYALGALDGEEVRELESHLAAGCDACEQQLKDFRRVSNELALLAEPTQAPMHLRSELMSRIGASVFPATSTPARAIKDIETPVHPWGRPWVRSVFALAASVAIVSLSWNVYKLRQTIEEQRSEIAAMRGQLAQQTELVNFLEKPDVRVASLQGLPPALSAQGRMIWHSRSRSGYFFASNLPVPPVNKTYQLWAIADGKPLSAGVFQVDQSGQGTLRVEPIAGAENAALFAVTLEPAGGRDVPSLDQMVLKGAL